MVTSLFRTFRYFSITVLAVTSIAGCNQQSNPRAGRSILIRREVLLPVNGIQSRGIIQTPAGNFVIGGKGRTAWAVSTDPDGQIRWRYADTAPKGAERTYQSEFSGLVALENNAVLLCGQSLSAAHPGGAGFITIFDTDGRVLEHRDVFPKGDPSFFSSAFRQCFKWNGGIALIGGGSDGQRGFVWVVKLDKNGTIEWESTNPEFPGVQAVASNDRTLVLIGSSGDETRLIRISQNGTVVARRVLRASSATLLRPAVPLKNVKLVAYDDHGHKAMIYTLNSDLQDIEPAKPITRVLTDNGCGYVLADMSVVLLGNIYRMAYQAAVGIVGQAGAPDTIRVFNVADSRDSSFTVRDAVLVTDHELVTVREQVNSINPANTGVVMSWIDLSVRPDHGMK